MHGQVTAMGNLWRGQRGAALVTVMLFMVLLLILITAMLTVAGNEAVISGLQRDGVRALELAQGGVQEAIRRIEEGRPFQAGFTSSLGSGVTVSVVRRVLGTNSAYQEIQVTAIVGRATRRLSHLILQRMIMFPPNILFGPAFEGKNVDTGDIYSQSYALITKDNIGPDVFTYAGWRISAAPDPDAVPPDPGVPVCYTHVDCVLAGGARAANWYPATRLTEPITTALGADIVSQTNKCPAGGGPPLPPSTISGVLASDPCTPSCTTVTVNVYGFDTDDPDGIGPLPPQAVVAGKVPCGLPYKMVSRTFNDETGTSITRLTKMIVFEQWFENYWQFDESQMTYVRKTSLATYPQFGAVPPVIDPAAVTSNFDRVVSGGGALAGDFGCKYPEMACVPPVDRPISVLLTGPGPWTITGTIKGHGTLVVNGDLNWVGDFEYWGTVIVNGTLNIVDPLGGNIYGGVVSTMPLNVHAGVHVFGGSTVTSVPVGRSVVVGKAWWER